MHFSSYKYKVLYSLVCTKHLTICVLIAIDKWISSSEWQGYTWWIVLCVCVCAGSRGIMGDLNRLIWSAELRLMWSLISDTMPFLFFASQKKDVSLHKHRFNGLRQAVCVCVLSIL